MDNKNKSLDLEDLERATGGINGNSLNDVRARSSLADKRLNNANTIPVKGDIGTMSDDNALPWELNQ